MTFIEQQQQRLSVHFVDVFLYRSWLYLIFRWCSWSNFSCLSMNNDILYRGKYFPSFVLTYILMHLCWVKLKIYAVTFKGKERISQKT